MPLNNPPANVTGMSTSGTEVGASAQDQKFINAMVSDLAAKLQEQASDPATPASGYREIFARDGNYLAEKDDGGNVHVLAWVAGEVVRLRFPAAITLTKAGAFSDSDSDADGFIGIDTTNGRLYFRHSGGTWQYVARLITQGEMNLTAAASATKQAVRYDEFSAQHVAATGAHGDVTASSFANTGPTDLQEKASDPATPSSGYRRVFARDGNYLAEKDDGGNVHALAWTSGEIATMLDEPRPAMYQHKAGATGSQYGNLRIEFGNDTLSTGSKAITFQAAFATILEVFLIDKAAANAMYPSAIGTSGFTANGTGSDTFAWLAIGVD